MNRRHEFCGSVRRLALAALSLLALVGCNGSPGQSTAGFTKVGSSSGEEHLAQALDSLRKLGEGSSQEYNDRTLFYLNQWIFDDPVAKAAWQPDPLVARMHESVKQTPGLNHLADLQFQQRDDPRLDPTQPPKNEPQDLTYLQQCIWLYDVAQRVRREPSPEHLADWIKEVEQRTSIPEAEKLAAAERAFDWTIRNLQLDPLLPMPKGPAATAGGSASQLPAAKGEPGPGYRYTPIELLKRGHGDAWERGRIFILLCRQLGIDAVMLGVFDSEVGPSAQAWLPAVHVGGELYLFDARLGIPILSPDGKGIATLRQVVDDPKLLRALDVEGEPYPIQEKHLEGMVAWIEAQPEALSRRMEALEQSMPGTQRIVLSVRPAKHEPELRKLKGIGQVSIWRVPFEAVLYQDGRIELAKKDRNVALELHREDMIYDTRRPLMKGHNLHLQGHFETVDKELGARTYYLQARPPDREIELLYTSSRMREQTGLAQQLPQDESLKKELLETILDTAYRSKHDATYWLGLTYFEGALATEGDRQRGNYEAAMEWLEKRTLAASPPSPWVAGARYNLARCYEALGNYDQARKLLESDTSPQRAGNLLRARMLAGRTAESTAAK